MRFVSLIFIFSLPVLSFCQGKISGKVVSEKGETLQQVSIFISNTSIGTYTDVKGEFTLSKLPQGIVTIVVSHVGYEVTTVPIPAADRNKRYIIRMEPKSNDLSTVLIGKYDKRGWKKWGRLFTETFIGTSSYAKDCLLKNTDAIYFIYNQKTKQLRTYAQEPLLIENKSLGYRLTVTLVDFMYDFSDNTVDYQVYTLFAELEGTEEEELKWRKNRADVYSLSMMHFMRALYARNFKNEGFQVRWIEMKANVEKQRVQALYKYNFSKVRDSIGGASVNEVSVNKLIEKTFSKDSLLFYNKVLKEEDRTGNLHLELLGFKDITSPADSNTVLFRFDDYLQVTYTKAKEPEEYTAYKNKLFGGDNSSETNTLRSYPSTELTLTRGIPAEVNEKGYFNNVDLFISGFWGWWEKMATRLPYEYEP